MSTGGVVARSLGLFLFCAFGYSAVWGADPLEFTVSVNGRFIKTVPRGGGVVHTIDMNVSGTLRVRPVNYTCDETRFLASRAVINGNLRVRGSADAGTFSYPFDEPHQISRPSSSTDSRFTPQTADYLYFITRDVIEVFPDVITVYAFEYVSSLQVIRIWIGLFEPFYYTADLEHYDFPASHTVSGISTAPSCLRGTVLAPGTGTAMPDAQVRFGGVARTSDANGAFQYDGIPPNTYLLTIDTPNYPQFRSVETIPAFSILDRNYQLRCCEVSKGTVPTEIDFETASSPFLQRRLKSIVAKSGQRLEVWWATPFLKAPHYELRYYPSGAAQTLEAGKLIGGCYFWQGVNSLSYIGPKASANEAPDCFVRVTWINTDYGADDKEKNGFPNGLLDVLVFEYEVCQQRLYTTRCQYTYGCEGSPPISLLPNFWEPICDKPVGSRVNCFPEPGSSGLQLARTAASGEVFDSLQEALDAQGVPDDEMVMGYSRVLAADFNLSGGIDGEDFETMTNAIGRCRGDADYVSLADANADGCISVSDMEVLFADDSDRDTIRDWEEWVAGTDPFNSVSVLRVSIDHDRRIGATLRWPSVAGRTYSVLRSGGLPWSGTAILTNILATPSLNSFVDSAATNQQSYYYRVEVR